MGKTYEGDNDFTIRVGLELVRLLERRAQLDMVVDLAVDREDELAVGAHERLRAGVWFRIELREFECKWCQHGERLQSIWAVHHAPTPTTARRSCARIVCLPL